MTEEPLSDDLIRQIHAAADGELTDAEMTAFRLQCAADPTCQKLYDQVLALRSAMHSASERHRLSPQLVERAIASLEAPRSRVPRFMPASRSAVAASFMLAFVLGGLGVHILDLNRPGAAPSLTALVVDDHRRSLLAETPIDVASSDRHTVRPWFDRRLALSPPVVDLKDHGFTLVGGRAAVIDGEAVPVIVYRIREHVISVAALRTARGDRSPDGQSLAGYNTLSWTEDHFTFIAASDLPRSDLDSFVGAYRAASAASEAAP